MHYLLIILLFMVMPFPDGEAALRRPSRQDFEVQSLNQEIHDNYDYIKFEVRNHDVEIRALEDKLNSLDLSLESVRSELLHVEESNQKLFHGNVSLLEEKMSSNATLTKGVSSDIKTLKEHANDTAVTLKKFSDRLDKLESNMNSMHQALVSMMDVLQIKEGVADPNAVTYKVQPGDSLEKIARKHGSTIKKLKELNNLKKDTIIVGQKLKIRE